jgi:hypothetical protein
MRSETIKIWEFLDKWKSLESVNYSYLILEIKDPTISFVIGKWIRGQLVNTATWIDEGKYSAKHWINDFCSYDM